MKNIITIMAIATYSFTALSAETISVNRPLKKKSIIEVITQSVEKFLSYDGDEISGGLDGDIKKPTIVEITKEGNQTLSLKVVYEAFFLSVDHDFGDPVHEEFTKCESILEKRNGKYSVENTKTNCDFNPATDIDPYWEREHPCCEGGRPVVDSNHCFDYYEEGREFCANYNGWDD